MTTRDNKMDKKQLLERIALLLGEYEEQGDGKIVGCYFEDENDIIHEYSGQSFMAWDPGFGIGKVNINSSRPEELTEEEGDKPILKSQHVTIKAGSNIVVNGRRMILAEDQSFYPSNSGEGIRVFAEPAR